MILEFALFLQSLSEQGVKSMREGRYGDAERVYRQLVKESPGKPEWHMNLGLALYSAGKYADAVKPFDSYLEAVPKPSPIHLMAGVNQLKLRSPCTALPYLQKARQWQASKEVLRPLAGAYAGCKRFAEAAAAFEAAGELRQAARAYWQSRNYEPARKLYQDLQAAHVSDPEFQYEFGDTLYRLEGAEAALPYLLRSTDVIPGRGMLGRSLLDLNRPAEAIPHLEAAANTDPALLLPLSRAYKAVGRVQDAAQAEADYRKRQN